MPHKIKKKSRKSMNDGGMKVSYGASKYKKMNRYSKRSTKKNSGSMAGIYNY